MDHEKIFSISIQTNGVNISFRLEKIECRCLFLSFCIVYTVCMRARAYIFLLFFFRLWIVCSTISHLKNIQCTGYAVWDFTISEVSKLFAMYQTTITIGLLVWHLTGKRGDRAYLCSWKFSFFSSSCYSIPYEYTIHKHGKKTVA